ncbi:helix-turn-helix transcriptional regulator [Limnovirga soli]|uniref:Helix-turn-helix domain-containing protein n=1 Tax=Limnovirga soli TaxID=2656915 RepID=A0A8J8FEW6_9BACT|nr:helix-turn-helix transcriptional regulator [Limnovirga soli]NNV53874.1 helix-turn-helix domain-containing protein [Limnovirga soli]
MKNNHLKSVRLQLGLTQKQVAQLLGMKIEDRLSHWEKGSATSSVQNLYKLAQLCQVKIEDLLS